MPMTDLSPANLRDSPASPEQHDRSITPRARANSGLYRRVAASTKTPAAARALRA